MAFYLELGVIQIKKIPWRKRNSSNWISHFFLPSCIIKKKSDVHLINGLIWLGYRTIFKVLFCAIFHIAASPRGQKKNTSTQENQNIKTENSKESAARMVENMKFLHAHIMRDPKISFDIGPKTDLWKIPSKLHYN